MSSKSGYLLLTWLKQMSSFVYFCKLININWLQTHWNIILPFILAPKRFKHVTKDGKTITILHFSTFLLILKWQQLHTNLPIPDFFWKNRDILHKSKLTVAVKCIRYPFCMYRFILDLLKHFAFKKYLVFSLLF